MPTPNPMTVDHWVGVLRRSNIPTIVVEGKMDIVIYRRLLERVGIQQTILLAADSRNKLLQVYERRREFAHVPVVFIADQDMWIFSGIPEDHADIIWTQGYSIENDLYISAELESFLTTHHGLFAIALDRPVSSQLFDRLIQEVERKLSDQKQRFTQ